MAILNTAPFKQLNPDLECSICLEEIQDQEATYRGLSSLDLATGPKYVVHTHSYGQSFEAHEDAYRRLLSLDLAREPKYVVLKNSLKIGTSKQPFEAHEEAYRRLSGLNLATEPKSIISNRLTNAVHSSCNNKWVEEKNSNHQPLNCGHCREAVHSLNGKRAHLPKINQLVNAPERETIIQPLLRLLGLQQSFQSPQLQQLTKILMRINYSLPIIGILAFYYLKLD